MDESDIVANYPTKGAFIKMTEGILKAREESSNNFLVANDTKELQVKQADALCQIGQALAGISQFVNGGGLANLLSVHVRTQALQQMLGGLTQHAGRDGLDARTVEQNAVEIVAHVEAVFKKFQENLASKNKVDPDMHDAEKDFKKWTESGD